MSRWRTLIAFVVLALWMPATSHCALEAAGLLEVGECCDVDTDGSHAASDACAPVDRELANPDTPAILGLPIFYFAYAIVLSDVPAAVGKDGGSLRREVLRPEVWLKRWDFEHRTALPARAPSTNS